MKRASAELRLKLDDRKGRKEEERDRKVGKKGERESEERSR